MALTPKQENFCLAYLETGNASEAYRRVYKVDNMTAPSINREAKHLLDHPKISTRIADLRKPIMKRHNVTLDSILGELEEARKLAMDIAMPAPAVSAAMGKAKLLGMDRQVIDHTSSDGSMTPTRIEIVAPSVNRPN